jgi:hypothetical protein
MNVVWSFHMASRCGAQVAREIHLTDKKKKKKKKKKFMVWKSLILS